MRGTELTDSSLCRAISEMEQGLIDAHLGGNLVKKRVALPGRGKRGSARTILATNNGDRWFFVFGFEKQEMDNIGPEELQWFKSYARILLALSALDLVKNLAGGSLEEICGD